MQFCLNKLIYTKNQLLQFPYAMLAQIDLAKIIDYILWKFVCGLCTNIAQVIFLCNIG